MQLNPVYLYSNKVDVFTNLDSWTVERYRQVYQRNFKVYRGVDNRLDLHVRNSDEKAKDINGYTLVFNLIERETQKLILSKNCTVTSTSNGRVSVTLSESELNDIQTGFYDFTVHSVNNATLVKTPLYVDSQFGVTGTLEVQGDVFGETKESQVIDTFAPIPTYWPNDGTSKSEISYASPEVSSTNTIHTFAIYQTNYTGTITIEASLQLGATPAAGKWTPVATISYPSNVRYQNIEGKWNWFRIRHVPATGNTGSLDKVVYR